KDVRKAAADALGGIRSHRATGSLIAAMDDSDETVRVSVVGALRQLRPTEAIDFLSSLLDQESRELRVEIASLLTEIGSDKGLDALIEAFCNDGVLAERSAVALAEIGSPKAVKTLVAALHSSNYISRFNAIRALKDIGSKEAESVLIQAVKDNVLRHDAISMLVELKSETALEYLSSLMTDKDDHVVTEAVAALGQYHSSGAVEILIGSICHKSSLVQDDIADALSRIDVETLTVCFGRALNHTNDCVRQRVASIIGYYSIDDLTLDQLTSLSQSDGAFQVRAVAKTAAEGFARKLELLGNIQSNVASPPLNDNESRELFLLGETFKIVAEAGHIFRPTPNSDWGIDGEIEFKNESGEASGFRVYLQLKSGDSHIRQNKRNRKEIFTIKNPRHARFWMSHAYPVLLVIRDSSGRIRWMNVTAYLREHGANTKQIEFKGEPFTAANIREMHNRFACQS
ncbi:MAG TPA: HEAT repeat domain-containing protein, partial [Pyrinomonadaceae bacterium]